MEENLTDDELQLDDAEDLCTQRANAHFKEQCEAPLLKINPVPKFAITSGSQAFIIIPLIRMISRDPLFRPGRDVGAPQTGFE